MQSYALIYFFYLLQSTNIVNVTIQKIKNYIAALHCNDQTINQFG